MWICLRNLNLAFLIVCQTRSEISDLPHNEQTISHDVQVKTVKVTEDELGLFVNQSSIPSVRQGKETLRKMCIQNAGNESYDKAEVSYKNYIFFITIDA